MDLGYILVYRVYIRAILYHPSFIGSRGLPQFIQLGLLGFCRDYIGVMEKKMESTI